MKLTNVGYLRSHLGSLLDYVLKGKEVEIQRRNISIAKIVPLKKSDGNKTKLGIGKNTVKFKGDLTEAIMENDWDMHS